MRACIEALEFKAPGGTVRVTASLGVASAASRHGDMRAMTRAADEALYRAKSEGRNRVVLAA